MVRIDLRDERWQAAPGYMGSYEVSDRGRVYSVRRPGASTSGRVMSAATSRHGYQYVNLRKSGRYTRFFVHQLVLLTFVGPYPEGMEIRHLDGDPTNNKLANLVYGTRSENIRDAVRHGTHRWASATHCIHGHAFDEVNTMYRKDGNRDCRICHRARGRASAERRMLKAAGYGRGAA